MHPDRHLVHQILKDLHIEHLEPPASHRGKIARVRQLVAPVDLSTLCIPLLLSDVPLQGRVWLSIRVLALQQGQAYMGHGVGRLPDNYRKVIVQPAERDLVVGQNVVQCESTKTFARDGEQTDDAVIVQLKNRVLHEVQGFSD